MDIEEYNEEKSNVETLVLRMGLCEGALETIIPDVYDPIDAELRADLLIAAESIQDKAHELLALARRIAWQNTKVPRGGFDEM